MKAINKTVNALGKITGKTFRATKQAPRKTIDLSKDLKDAFVDGLNSDKPKTPTLPEI